MEDQSVVQAKEMSKRIIVLTICCTIIAAFVAVCFMYPERALECKSIERSVEGRTGSSEIGTPEYRPQPERPSLNYSIPLTEERTLRLPTYNRNTSRNTVMNPWFQEQPDGYLP